VTISQQLWPYVALLVVGFLPNEVWRYLALVMAQSLDDDSEFIVLARTIATALITGVVAKLVVFSGGELAGFPFAVRLAAAGGGFLAFAAFRRSVFAGVAAGELLLIAGGVLFRH
jgi:branched-subunit amino acid transport protein AzlD